MPAVTIRNLPEATHRALKVRAAHHGRSTEAEMREILETAVRAQGRLLIGSLLSQRRRKIGLTHADLEAMSANRDPAAARSEERRVGKECVSPCRVRWGPYD